MATITTRSGKGSPLTNTEVDNNFTNLNTDKQEVLTEGAFTDGDKTKLDGIESGADVTDTANVTAAGALMDSEVTNLAQVKAFDSADYATAAQGTLADSALQSIPDDYVLNTGDSITGNLSFGDYDKAIFGAGSDLQIYHDGTRSYVDDTGAGSLWLRGGDVAIMSTADESMATFANNGAAKIYYDGSEKLATTSTGIDVTGTVTADGLTVGAVAYPSTDGTADQVLTTDGSGTISFADAPVSLPDQTGYSGYYLTTNGTSASWAQVSGGGGSNADGGFANSTYISAQSVDGGSASG